MPGRPEIVRLLALAAFISIVALATWLAELSRGLVIVTIAAALALAWTIEWLAWRETRLRLSQTFVEEGDEGEEASFEKPPAKPAAVAEPARSERSWFQLRKTPAKDEREGPLKPPLAPVAPVVEGRARVLPTDAARANAVAETESAEPAVPEGPEPVPSEDARSPVAASAAERPPLFPVPPPTAAEPASEHAVETAPREESPVVNFAARTRGPRMWNLWELERLAREEFKGEALEQSQFLFIHLRQFARADGQLPLEFDELVRDSFGALLERHQHA